VLRKCGLSPNSKGVSEQTAMKRGKEKRGAMLPYFQRFTQLKRDQKSPCYFNQILFFASFTRPGSRIMDIFVAVLIDIKKQRLSGRV